MGDLDDVRIETLEDQQDAQVRAMLVDLALAEQRHFDHPEETSEQLSARLTTSPRFMRTARRSDSAGWCFSTRALGLKLRLRSSMSGRRAEARGWLTAS